MRARCPWRLFLLSMVLVGLLAGCSQEPREEPVEPAVSPDVEPVVEAPGDEESEVSTWILRFDGADYAVFTDILVRDEDILVVGATAQKSASDVLLASLSFDGDLNWKKTYGGTRYDQGMGILETPDGGLLILAETESFGAGKRDIYILHADAEGREVWTQTFGGPGTEWARRMIMLSSGEYAAVGESDSLHGTDFDAYVVRFDLEGEQVWSGSFGEREEDESGAALLETDNGDLLVLAGVAYPGGYLHAHRDTRLFRVTGEGRERWSVLYRGDRRQYANDMAFTDDGDVILAGLSETIAEVPGPTDFWIARVSAETGFEQWSRVEGSSFSDDYGYSMVQTERSDEFMVVGFGPQLPVFRFTDEGKTVWVRASGKDTTYGGMAIAKLPDDVLGGYVIAGLTDTGLVVDRLDAVLVRVGPNGEGMRAQGIPFKEALGSD